LQLTLAVGRGLSGLVSRQSPIGSTSPLVPICRGQFAVFDSSISMPGEGGAFARPALAYLVVTRTAEIDS